MKKSNVSKVKALASSSKVATKQAQVLTEYFVHQDGGLYNVFTDPRGVVQVIRTNKSDVLQNLHIDHGLAAGSDNKPGLGRRMFRTIRMNNVINGKLPISGKKKGVYEFGDQRVLVDSEPRFVDSKKGNWDTIKEIIDQLLGGYSDQVETTYGYLKCSRSSLRKSLDNLHFRPGQAFIIKGEPNDGKTFFTSSILAPLIGRTCFNPVPFLSGQSDRNGDLIGNEMWLIDDRGGSMDLDRRLTMSENIKNAIAGKGFQYHDKYEKAVSFTSARLFNRIIFLVNNTDNSMRCLPSLEETRDKLIVVKSRTIQFKGSLKNDTDEEQSKLDGQIESELPAFAHFLDNYKIKNTCVRFGQAGFINSDAEFEIEDNEEHTALWQIMKKFIFRDSGRTCLKPGKKATTQWVELDEWEGTTSEAMAKMEITAGREFEVMGIKDSRKMGKLISLLSKSLPDHVFKFPRTSGGRGWKIVK